MQGGRPPKPAGQKVTRHPSTKPQVSLPRRGRSGGAPKPVCDLSEAGTALWAAIWKLPEATRWGPIDVPPLSRLVVLQSDPERWGDPRLLAEMRQLEDRFGMNAQSRQALGWSIEGDEAPASPAAPPPAQRRKDEALRLLRGDQTG